MFMNIRSAGVLLCAVLATSCASKPWRDDPAVTAGRWETSPDSTTSRTMVAPRNDLAYAPGTPTTQGSTTRPARRARGPASLTGVVTVGSEGAKAGLPDSEAHLDFRCGTGKGTCTVEVQIETQVNLDNEHLDVRVQQINSAGRPINSSKAVTRQAGMIEGEPVTYALSVPCGRVRVSVRGVDSPGGKEGIQSRWTARILRFRCH
jgi:hypothetical protein